LLQQSKTVRVDDEIRVDNERGGLMNRSAVRRSIPTKWLAIVPAALLMALLVGAPPAEARVRLGGVVVGGGYSHFSGHRGYGRPGFYRPYYRPFYGSFYDPFYDGFYHPGYRSGYRQGPRMGQVKLKDAPKQAEVYLDGGYAGVAGDLKNIWLQPGAYNIEVRDGGLSHAERIYVLSGKTVRIEPELIPRKEQP
jgi:hypothetical protein